MWGPDNAYGTADGDTGAALSSVVCTIIPIGKNVAAGVAEISRTRAAEAAFLAFVATVVAQCRQLNTWLAFNP
jgi:hypothetical protein